MISYTPEQVEAIRRAVGSTATQANVALSEPIERLEAFLKNAAAFIKRNHPIIGDRPYVLLLAKTASGGREVTGKLVLSFLRQGKPFFYVDDKLRLARVEEGLATLADCGKKTEDEKTLGVAAFGTYECDILLGKITADRNVLYPNAAPWTGFKLLHPMADFEVLLQEHKSRCLDRQQNVKYWADPRERILRGKPDTTESIFHLSLFWWLDTFVLDKLKVLGETVGLGQDKTDIEVVTTVGTYLVEIKWLGKNENGTVYGQSIIDTGLAQVKIYLEHDQDSQFICAHLVVYDARPLEAHQTQSSYDDSNRHSICKPPHILFLESETPSETARRITR